METNDIKKPIFENEMLYILKEDSSIPWVKIFPKKECKELSDCDKSIQDILINTMIVAQKAMIDFYNPTKINIAMFGNYLPKLHIHVMARFKNDSHYPEPMWGRKQRESSLNLPSFNDFIQILQEKLK